MSSFLNVKGHKMAAGLSLARPTRALVDLKKIAHNFQTIRKLTPATQKIWGVVKANAYGHGLVPVAKTLVDQGATALAVATLEEGLALREAGMTVPVYILDGILGDLSDYQEKNLTPVLHRAEEVKQAIAFARQGRPFFRICLKFDTGMGRLGMFAKEVPQVLQWLSVSSLEVDTVLTHLASADEGLEKTEAPYQIFAQIRSQFCEAGLGHVDFSICNSASILDKHFADFQTVRPGLALYGVLPNPRFQGVLDLQPALKLVSRLISLKNYPKGHGIGYGSTFVTTRASKIGIIPIGYADGYPRLVSNRGAVLIRGQRAPVVGRVSMDLMAVDVTDIKAENHDDVVLIGSDGGDEISAVQVAQWSETISYEILTGIQKRVPRVYI